MSELDDKIAMECYNLKLAYPNEYMQRIIDYLALGHLPYEQARHRVKRAWQRGENLSLRKVINNQEESIIRFDDIEKVFCKIIDKKRNAPTHLLVSSDWHLPFDHSKAVQLTANLANQSELDAHIINGDLFDFPEYSTFEQEPQFMWQDLMDTAFNKLAKHKALFPNVPTILLCGNHEYRLLSYQNKSNNRSDRKTIIKDWYNRLRELDILFGGFKCDSVHYKRLLLIQHGVKSGPNISHKNLHSDGFGFNLSVFGHVHHASIETLHNMAGTFVSITTGALCVGQPHYKKNNTPENWNLGACFITADAFNDVTYHDNMVYTQNGNSVEIMREKEIWRV